MNARPRSGSSGEHAIVSGIYESIDLVTAALLLTGQITMTGVFVVPEGLYLGITGPIFGGVRMTGKTAGAHVALDLLDIFTALLLVMGELTVTGPYVTSGRLFIVVSGPPLGIADAPIPAVPANAPTVSHQARDSLYSEFRREVIKRNIGAKYL